MEKYLSKLDRSQRRGLSVLCSNDGGAIWHRVGTGKTRVAYAWFATIAKDEVPKGVTPCFFVVCRREAFNDWYDECQKMELDFVVVDYEKYLGKNKTTLPRVFLVSHGILHKVADEISKWKSTCYGVVFDEGFLYNNCRTLHCKSAHDASVAIGKAAILSGSVITARNLENVYGQLYAINLHHILARSLTDFRSKYMFDLHISMGTTAFRKGIARRGSVQRISNLVADVASIHFPDSPRESKEIIREISPSEQQRNLFERLREDYFVESDVGYLEIKSATALITKCQQISDGWLRQSEGEILTVKSIKVEYVVQQIKELVACGERVIVWCAFRESVKRLLQLLQSRLGHSIKCQGFWSGNKFNVEAWRSGGQVAIGTEDSGSSVNHFEQCAHSIYYSMSPKWLSLQQSMGRTDRKSSQHKTCWYYFLQTKGSLDATVLAAARSSRLKEQEFLQLGIRKWANQQK